MLEMLCDPPLELVKAEKWLKTNIPGSKIWPKALLGQKPNITLFRNVLIFH